MECQKLSDLWLRVALWAFVVSGLPRWVLAESPAPVNSNAPNSTAELWRVKTTLKTGDQVTAEFVTLFDRGMVYDLSLDSGRERAVFDMAARRFELLDSERRLRCMLDGTSVIQLMAQIELRSARVPDPLVKFAASPHFTVSFDSNVPQLLFQSPPLVYCVTGSVVPPERLNAYLDFADWSARLGAIRPGGLPAAARVFVNRELRVRQLAPRIVTREVRWSDHVDTVQTEHEFGDAVPTEDLPRIREVDQQRQSFTVVGPNDYFRLQGPPK